MSLRQEFDLKQEASAQQLLDMCPDMHDVNVLVERARLCRSVLITGETGTGKEVVAKAIHTRKAERPGHMVTVDCTALNENLAESILFGHERGAFTGASSQHRGQVECAHQGTLYLDEVAVLPKPLQPKFLRILNGNSYHRVGGSVPITSEFHVIAATNRNLETMTEEGLFASDLYHRLNVFPIDLPPLRERPRDVPVLVEFFLDKWCREYQKSGTQLSTQARDNLFRYAWPGNVRELSNVVERAVLVSDGSISTEHLRFRRSTTDSQSVKEVPQEEGLSTLMEKFVKLAKDKGHSGGISELVDKKLTEVAYALSERNQSQTARFLGVARISVRARMKKYGIV